jgi:hypothetical protein
MRKPFLGYGLVIIFALMQLFHVQYTLLAGFSFNAILNIDGVNDLVLAK